MNKVSVIIPAYNREKMLARAVDSVLTQTYHDFEFIVIDDGSIEDLAVIKEKVEGAGHIWISVPNGGVAKARNLGVRHSSGEYLAFLDSDDQWLPEKLEKQLAYLHKHSQYRICQCEENWFRHGRFANQCKHHRKPEGDVFKNSLKLCCISPSSVLMERSLFDEFGGFDEDFVVCEDYELWLRVTAQYELGLLNDVLVVKYGGHSDQLSHSQIAMDRYRIVAISKLLCFPNLSEQQKLLAVNELRVKTEVLWKGAHKHKNGYLLDRLGVLRDLLEKKRFDNLRESFGLIKELLEPIQDASSVYIKKSDF
ncbi:MAG: glycosyltransferase [Deltaproteobacteria bacterium]|nr:glycosyltransferase [Deltaproteobacteria bacterium]